MSEANRPLKVFLSYASQDKPPVRELSRRLVGEGWIDTWLDEKNLLPGQDWRVKIEEAVEEADIVIIVLSQHSVSKEGHVQKELRYAREIALEKPEDAIFLIPLRLDECEVPRGLRFYQWVDYFGEKKDSSYSALVQSLKLRYGQKLKLEEAERARKEKEEQEREAAEKLAREKEAKEKAERDAAEKARLEAEEQARQRSAKEKEERQVARRAKLLKLYSDIQTVLKSTFLKSKPIIRNLGIIGIVAILFWLGSWGVPKLVSLLPTATSTATFTMTPKVITPSRVVETIQPIKTSTKPVTPTKKTTPTPVLGVGSTMIGKDGATLLYVPSGEFEMGESVFDAMAECRKVSDECSLDWFTDEEPIHTVYLDAYWIDQTEVTNEMFSKFVAETGYETDAEKDAGAYKFVNDMWHQTEGVSWLQPSGKGSNISNIMDHPVVNVTWGDAKAYCEWAGKRLPTEAEWEKAAGWNDKLKVKNIYPWGDVFDCKKGNFDDETQVDSYVVKGGAGCDGFSQTAPVGSFPEGASFYDVLDMAGNVWEWVEDWYNPEYYNSSSALSNPLGPSFGSEHVSRGGSWMFQYAFYFRTADRGWYIPIDAIPNAGNGFRCAKDAP